ncbi:MAG TPA: homocysteine S-methyltransferase [Glaciecola sp.]|jgi:S-methylmethionine-dependent homocysteine/selenocysteine methylase|nr:homocysteine S-methyltransferase [Glaciecola sp.]
MIILDGGMGQELLARSEREVTTMWSADIMLHEPNLVADLHYDFIQAGAQIITLNTYTATPQRLQLNNASDKLETLHALAGKAALDAINRAELKPKVKIAGCLPPLVASYHPDRSPEYSESLETYRQLVTLQAPYSDLYICETMSSINEAKAACTAAKESGKPVWLAFSVCDDNPTQLRGGDALVDAIAELVPEYTDTVLLNCSRPEAIEQALPYLNGKVEQIGVYANGFTSITSLYPGTTVKSLTTRHDLDPQEYAQHALLWAQQGATIIGGCCEIGPAHIKVLSEALS